MPARTAIIINMAWVGSLAPPRLFFLCPVRGLSSYFLLARLRMSFFGLGSAAIVGGCLTGRISSQGWVQRPTV